MGDTAWNLFATNRGLVRGQRCVGTGIGHRDSGNPPYVPQSQVPQQPEVRDFDPSLALYGGSSDGMLIPEQIIRRAYALLRPGGLFLMEHDISQPDRTVAFARASGFSDARTGADLTYRPRYLVATK